MTIPAAIKTASENTPWQSPDTAPKDKCFIGIFKGYPHPTQARWNPAMEKFCYVELCVNPANKNYDGGCCCCCVEYEGSEEDDYFFENKWVDKKYLLAWIPMEEWK